MISKSPEHSDIYITLIITSFLFLISSFHAFHIYKLLSGTVNLYEFVSLYETFSRGSTPSNSTYGSEGRIDSGGMSKGTGHRLSMRTVESCNRILQIRSGFGNCKTMLHILKPFITSICLYKYGEEKK